MDDRLPFQTGSRVYGVPKPDSDFDLVVRMDDKTADDLRKFVGCWKIVCGSLNLIACTSDEQYDAWLRARDLCLAERPCSRERAVEIHHTDPKCGGYEDAGSAPHQTNATATSKKTGDTSC